MIEAYQEKFDYLMAHRMRAGMCWCPISWEKYGQIKKPDTLHHAKVHNVEWGRSAYPLLIDSIMNLVPVWNPAHVQWPSWGKVSDIEAENLEAFLQRHPMIAMWVNTMVWATEEEAIEWLTKRRGK